MYELLEIVGSLTAGLGLFFVGMQGLRDNLQKMTGRRFRQWIGRWTGNRLLGLTWGALSGAITQSTSAVTFIVVSILSVGAISLQGALPIVAGSNLGASVMIFLATLDIHTAVLFVVGLAGILYTSDRMAGVKPLLGAMLGGGLLFLGLYMLRTGAAPLTDMPWFQELLQKTADHYVLVFLVGAMLTVLAQSSVAITLLGIQMTSVGLLTPPQCVLLIYSANLGAGVTAYVLGGRLTGQPRQLALFQSLFNVLGCLLLLPLFYLEVAHGVELVMALLERLSGNLERQMSWAYLVFNGSVAVVTMLLQGPIIKVLARLAPPSKADDEARVHFLHDQAMEDVETALDLVDREQHRLVARLPRYLDCARRGSEEAATELAGLHHSFTAVSEVVDSFLDELSRRDPGRHAFERLSTCVHRQRLMTSLEATLRELSGFVLNGERGQARLDQLLDNVVEAVDVVLLTLNDAWRDRDEHDCLMLSRLTGDRSSLMQRIRQSYLDSEEGLSGDQRLTLLHVTSLCERLFWLLGGLSEGLQPAGAEEAATVAEPETVMDSGG